MAFPTSVWRPPRACDDYWREYKHCQSFQHLFHSYYTFGSAPSCQQWKLDYYSCQEWEKHHSAQAKDALQASERKRVEEKQQYKPVWELRKKPPHDWYLPLQEERENKR
uniref:Synaptic plasticity regulator PANTS n=2 Tax=Erpetoichthys calabaricus TaxID=27687 RepID=A0A8C4TCN1_ERPCA